MMVLVQQYVKLFEESFNYLKKQAVKGAYPPVEGAIPNAMTTAEVVSALLEVTPENKSGEIVTNAINHLKKWQSEEGYWTDPNDADPWDVSSTSWSIWALVSSGMGVYSREIECAKNWLEKTIMPDGGLPTNSRGERSNTYATSYTLRAFNKINAKEPANKCLRFISSVQNKDGGWGLWPQGPSEATLTSYVLHGLLDGGIDINSRLFRSGIYWLISDRKENGTWGSWLDEEHSVEGTAFSLYILNRSGYLGKVNVALSLKFLMDRLDDGSIWRINGKNQIWVAVSVLLASNSILSRVGRIEHAKKQCK